MSSLKGGLNIESNSKSQVELNNERTLEEAIDRYLKKINGTPSLIRKDQEEEIVNTLKSGENVYIRGYWRMGKTTMLNTINSHFPGVSFNVDLYQSVAACRNTLAQRISDKLYVRNNASIASIYGKKQGEGIRPWTNDDFKAQGEIKQRILEEYDNPIDFYNNYLAEQNLTAVIGIDEVIGNVNDPDIMNFITSLDKKYSNLRIAFVLHRTGGSLEMDLMNYFKKNQTFVISGATEGEAMSLLSSDICGEKISITDEAKSAIIHFAGTIPHRINELLREIFREVRLDLTNIVKSHDGIVTITKEIVENIAKETWKDDKGDIGRNNKRLVNFAFNEDEQEIAYKLLTGNLSFETVENNFSEDQRAALESLLQYGAVVAETESKQFKFNGEMLSLSALKAGNVFPSDRTAFWEEENPFRVRVKSIIESNRP